MNSKTKEEKSNIIKKRKLTNQKKYGGNSPSCSSEVQKKTIQTNVKKYGTIHPNQNEEMKEKVAKSNITKYGVKSTAQLEEVKEKVRNTCLEKYGVVSTALVPEIREKQKTTLLKNYGVEHASQSIIVKQKKVETSLSKWGTEHPSQNQEVMERTQKNAKKYKEFKMPSGDIRKVQRYEPFALTDLLKNYTEEQIKTDRKDVPRIQYEVDGKKKYHFPDIFIPHEKKIVEVKSTWTYKCKTNNIQLKKKTAEEQGFLYEIWCYDAKGLKLPV